MTVLACNSQNFLNAGLYRAARIGAAEQPHPLRHAAAHMQLCPYDSTTCDDCQVSRAAYAEHLTVARLVGHYAQDVNLANSLHRAMVLVSVQDLARIPVGRGLVSNLPLIAQTDTLLAHWLYLQGTRLRARTAQRYA